MDKKYLDEIKAREQAATPGPWFTWADWLVHTETNVGQNGVPPKAVIGTFNKLNPDFIAHARHDIPALVAEVERLTEENNGLAVNGGKYIKIAQYRYELLEATAEQAEKAEIANIEKDQQIATLKRALELAIGNHSAKREQIERLADYFIKQAQEEQP